MSNYKYFIQEGNRFHLKTSRPIAIVRAIACLAIGIAVYFIVPPEKKIGLWGAMIFVFFALVNLLKTTKRLVIDTTARTITHKNNLLNAEAVYRYDDFEQFYVLTGKYLFLTMDSTAFFIFNQEGREKRVPIVVGLFSTRPVQDAINETSSIMGFDAR